MTTPNTELSPRRAHSSRLAFWRRFWHSPPVTLGIWTVVALLLGMASARAQMASVTGFCDELPADSADAGPKWSYFTASCALYEIDYEGFLAMMPEDGSVRVETVNDPTAPHSATNRRDYYDRDLSPELFRTRVQPVLRELIVSDAVRGAWGPGVPQALTCEDDGRCSQTTVDAVLELRLSQEGGRVRLVSMRVEYPYGGWDEGC